jgi:ElaB/YqjD/DUF883 family membrane-anchored ribosome-binding protein
METQLDSMEQAQDTLARERVVEDLKALVKDSEELLKATAGDVSDKAREARTRLAAALERARASCEHLQEQTLAKAKAAAKKADATIRSHPYESIGIAFGVGVLIGFLISRK